MGGGLEIAMYLIQFCCSADAAPGKAFGSEYVAP
jgi:hypothetical protein